MRKHIKIPRILKIERIDGFTVQVMFNNSESRILDFKQIFESWNVMKTDIENPLLDIKEFQKVELRNQTLSWPNITITLKNDEGVDERHPYEIGPDVLYDLSSEMSGETNHRFGKLIRTARIKAGLTQEEVAHRSGTSRFYISRVENNKTDIELSTFKKIVEAGLGMNLKLVIEP